MALKWRPVHGVLLFDKPFELSSNAAVQKVRRLFGAEKAGHTGTLDPLATGLLPVCLGEATKFSMGLLESDKAYLATLKLGEITSTGDMEGEVISRSEVRVSELDLLRALSELHGDILQLPPMHSALKYKGKPLYEYIRKGETVERQPRQVHIYELEMLRFQDSEVDIKVQCSKGTYIRTLAEDIGAKLGCGAHLKGLRRIATGPFQVDQAYTLSQLESMNLVELEAVLLPVDCMLLNTQKIDLDGQQIFRLSQGQRLGLDHTLADGMVRLYSDGNFAGMGKVEGRRLSPYRLVAELAIKASSQREFGVAQ
jgi:tRNA pseudouridine55 synthase